MNKEEILELVRKDYGEDALFTLDDYVKAPIDVISTGSFILDNFVLEVGGLPRGRVTMISGAEDSGKTTVSLQVTAQAQQLGLMATYVDAEQALDVGYAANLGVDVENVLISQPPTLTKGLAIMDKLCKIATMGLIVYDSVPAIGTGEEYDTTDYEEVKAEYGKRANMINIFFRRNIYDIRKNNIAVVFVNQLRDNITRGSFAAKKTRTPGGRGLKHYASVLLELTYTGKIKDGSELIGQEVNVYTAKNKVARPYRSATVNIFGGLGIDYVGDILLAGDDLGVISRRHSWYVYNGETIAQGKLNTINALKADSELLNMIKQEIVETWQNE